MLQPATAEGEVDVCVVGAGIVGLATAREIARRRPDHSIRVLEREDEPATRQTARNSGVIHAGIYYAPDSLKARLCVQGAAELYAFCEERGIETRRCGKVILATSAEELPRLSELERRGRANGVPGLRWIEGDELAERVPGLRGLAALDSPHTGIVDFGAVARALATELREAGAEIATGAPVTAIAVEGGRVRFTTPSGETRARHAVLCAGAWSDRLAVMAGAPAEPRIVPFRGRYLRLAPPRRDAVQTNVYPVPDPDLPFLGMHLTPTIDGEVLLGPSALLVGARDAEESAWRLRARDLGETLAWPGTWRMAARWWRTGLVEIGQAASRRAFAREVRRFIPDVEASELLPGFAGIRGQALARDGRLVDDFVVSGTERARHVRNAPSPAATSALAIARLIADRAERELGL